MSVTSVREIAGRDADSSGLTDTKISRSWRVTTNNTNDDAVVIFSDPRLPTILSPHPHNLYLLARRATCRQEKAPFIWIASIEYSSVPNPQKLQNEQVIANPIQRPARVSLAARKDKKIPRWGTPYLYSSGHLATSAAFITTSAGASFDSYPEIDDSIWVISVTFNANPIPSWFWDYENCTNNADLSLFNRTFPRGTLKISGLRFGEYQQEQGFNYYPIAFEVEYRPTENYNGLGGAQNIPGHYYTLVDRGFTDSSGNKFLNNDKTIPHVPLLMDGQGGKLANPSTATPFYRTWAVFPEVDFSVLPFIPAAPIP